MLHVGVDGEVGPSGEIGQQLLRMGTGGLDRIVTELEV